MGYLFENMEKMDIQEERKKTADATRKLESANRKLEGASRKLESANRKAEEAGKKTEEIIRMLVEVCQETGMTKEAACAKIAAKIKESLKGDSSKAEALINEEAEAEAEKKVERYWKQ